MLAKRPEDRFQTAGDVVRALRPLAAGTRILGRAAAVTAAVQSAADTLHAAKVPTDAEVLLSHMAESQPSSVRKRYAQMASLNRKQMLRLCVVVGAVVLAVAGIGWSLTGSSKPKNPPDPKDEPKPPPIVLAPVPHSIRRQFPGHYASIAAVAWSPDGQYLATGGGEGDIRVRDPVTRKTQTVFDEHPGMIISLAWSRDGELIVSEDLSGEIYVWKAQTGKSVAHFKRAAPVNFHRVWYFEWGGIAISPDNSEVAYEDDAGKAVRYSLKENRPIWKEPGGGSELRYSPSGKYLASSLGPPFAWETKSGEPVCNTTAVRHIYDNRDAHVTPGFLADDTLVLMQHRRIHLWNCAEDKPIPHIPELEIPQAVSWACGKMFAVSPNGDCCRVLTVTESIEIELPGGKRTPHAWKGRPLVENPNMLLGDGFTRWDVSFSRTKIAASWVTHVDILDLNTGEATTPFGNESHSIPYANESRPIGNRFLDTGGAVWDMSAGAITTRIPAKSCLVEEKWIRYIHQDQVLTRPASEEDAGESPGPVLLEGLADEQSIWPTLVLSADGKRVIGPTREGGTLVAPGPYARTTSPTAKGIRIWDATTGRLHRTFDFPEGKTEQYLVSPDQKFIIFQEPDRPMRIWRPESDESVIELTPEFQVELYRSAISPDGLRIATGTHKRQDDAVLLWNASDGVKQATIQTGLDDMFDPYIVQFSSSGRFLLVTRKIWDVNAAPPKLVWECPEQSHFFRFGQFVADERHVLIAQDAQLQIWDWRENQKLASLFWLHNQEAVFVNHLTRHFSGSPAAYQYLHTDYDREDGRPPVDMTIRDYEDATGWKNDPSQAGLNLEERKRELEGKAKAE